MKWRHLLVMGSLICLSTTGHAKAQPSDYFSGFYGGFDGGVISYNTQITFDGVNDPAGRGGAGYGAFFGYNHAYGKLLLGAELLLNSASVPDPYTFDSAVVGFAELDLRRGISFGLDVHIGYLITEKILLYGSVGYSGNKQSVRIDGVLLDQFAGGAATEKFGTFQVGAGLEAAIHPKLGIRVSFRSLAGHDLNVADFGTILTEASITRFDVEPSQQQFFAGLIFLF